MDLTGKNVYISGPMTGRAHYGVAEFALAHAALKEAGAEYVYNPAMRYLVKSQRKLAAMRHEDWMCDCIHELTERERRDQTWVEITPMKYDLLVQLPGWEESEGALEEFSVAKACGIKVASIEEALAKDTEAW